MILSVLKGNEIRVEEILKRSFAEYDSQVNRERERERGISRSKSKEYEKEKSFSYFMKLVF